MKIDWTEDHTETLASETDMSPGDGYVSLSFLPGGASFLFKPSKVERVDGIDYKAFKICSIWIGQCRQWWAEEGEYSANDLFKWDAPMSTMQPGISVMINLRNVSKKPQKFAVKLVGKRT